MVPPAQIYFKREIEMLSSKIQMLSAIALSAIAFAAHMPQALAQTTYPVKPDRQSTETEAGGTAQAARDAERLKASGAKMSTVRNLLGPSELVRETETDITTYEIGKEVSGLGNYVLRSRYINVGAKGIVPIHGHADRPGILQIVEGEIVQHRSDRITNNMVPGDITIESLKLAHWWENLGDRPVRIWSVDICNAVTNPGVCGFGQNDGATLIGPSKAAETSTPMAKSAVTGVSENAQIDLTQEFPDASGTRNLALRSRTVTLEPGARLLPDSPRPRPTFFRVMKGAMTYDGSPEKRSFVAGQIVFDAGSVARWSNEGTEPAVLHMVDVSDRTSRSQP